jgi:hypothetical protein
MAKKKKPTAWEIAKPLLEADIVANRVRPNMAAKEIITHRQEYRNVPYNNFVTNLRNLRNTLMNLFERASVDDAAVRNDLIAHPIQMDNPSMAYPRWDLSKAQGLLKMDVDLKKNEKMKPSDLWESRPNEYKQFPLKVFRDHLKQEIRGRVEPAYWIVKKGKKKAAADKAAANKAAVESNAVPDREEEEDHHYEDNGCTVNEAHD